MMNIKKYAVEAVRYRNELNLLLKSLDVKDLEQGLVVVKDSLLSADLKQAILAKAGCLLTDYSLAFNNGHILMQASVNARQLGPVAVSYQIAIQELRFDDTGHKLYATFKETAEPLGNMAQKLAFKAAQMNGPLLKTALKLSNVSWAYVDGNNILIDFDRLNFTKNLPASLSLNYISAKDSKLTLSYNL